MTKVVGQNWNLSIFTTHFNYKCQATFIISRTFSLSLRSFRFTWRPPAVLHTSYKTLNLAAIHTLTCIAALCKRQFLPLVCCMKRYKQEVSCWHALTMESLAFLTVRVFSQRQKWKRIRLNRMEVRGKERLGAAALLRHFPRNYETKKRGNLRNKVCRWRRRFIYACLQVSDTAVCAVSVWRRASCQVCTGPEESWIRRKHPALHL